ncbi:MAG: hypothetical protein F4Y53_06345 [Proteobacteria bacterium]|nr:hypothetical protein [Pseudomonadota bacterium]
MKHRSQSASRTCVAFTIVLALLGISACSGGGGGGSSAPEAESTPPANRASEIVITPPATPAPQTETSTTVQQQVSPVSPPPVSPPRVQLTGVEFEVRNSSGRWTSLLLTPEPVDAYLGGYGFSWTDGLDAGNIFSTEPFRDGILISFRCASGYSGDIDLTLIISQPRIESTVSFSCP